MHDRASRPSWAVAIQQRRKKLRLRQIELAELAGCSTRFVHTLEAGKSTVRLDKVLIVLGVLGLGFKLAAGSGITLDGGLAERP
jgi:y4mF family transcriptional regulator